MLKPLFIFTLSLLMVSCHYDVLKESEYDVTEDQDKGEEEIDPVIPKDAKKVSKDDTGLPSFLIGENTIPKTKKWVKVENMSDEFDGKIDYSKWHTNPKENGWTWIGRPPGFFDEESFYISDGVLCCEVKKYKKPITVEGLVYKYRGGILRSMNSAGVGHYFECRMKANTTEMSSTFWLKPRIECGFNLELDIQECVGATNESTEPFGRSWDKIMHSNMFEFRTWCHSKDFKVGHKQGAVRLEEKNSSRYFIYGCYLESETKAHFYIDGKYVYSITPSIPYTKDMFITMAMETYDWNPISSEGDLHIENGTRDDRTTRYDWVRTWKLVDKATEEL